MSATDAIILMRNTVMYKNICDDFKEWIKYCGCKCGEDAIYKLTVLVDEAVEKADIDLVKSLCNIYGVINMINVSEKHIDNIYDIMRDKCDCEKSRLFLYCAMKEELWNEFKEILMKEEDSECDESDEDSECEESDEDL